MNEQTTELEGIDRTREAHIAALKAGEADAWVACFAADAVQMPPHSPPNVGTDSIRAWSGGLLAAAEETGLALARQMLEVGFLELGE